MDKSIATNSEYSNLSHSFLAFDYSFGTSAMNLVWPTAYIKKTEQ